MPEERDGDGERVWGIGDVEEGEAEWGRELRKFKR